MSTALLDPAALVRLNPAPGGHRVGLRAGLSVAVPLLVVLALGHPSWAPYASFGAFTSLYGRKDAYLTRAQMQLSAAITLTAAVVGGVLVACLPHPHLWQVPVAALVAFAGQLIAKAHRYHAPGPLFLVFAFGGVSAAAHTPSDAWVAAVVCGCSALFAVLVGVAGLLRHPSRIGAHWSATGWLRLEPVVNWQPAWVALAVLVAGTASNLLQIGHPYWAMVSAVAPLSAPHVTSQLVRAVHRSVGTAVGLIPAGLLLGAGLRARWLVLAVAVLQIVVEMLVARNYALACVFITPLALTMGELGHSQPLGPLLFDRGVETVVGCLVGMLVALAGHALRQRRLLRHAPLT